MALIDGLSNIGDAIREKTGTSDLIPFKDMPQAILDIVSGGGANYTSITYNADDTIALVDKDGTEHTMVCTYEDDRLISVTYDGKAIKLGYEGEELKSIGKTTVDMASVPLATACGIGVCYPIRVIAETPTVRIEQGE